MVIFLNQANLRLKQSLEEKNKDLHRFESQYLDLNNKISEYETKDLELKHPTASTRIMSTKIVELSKKLRDKTSEIEAYKNLISKLQQKLLTENSKTIENETVSKDNDDETKEESPDLLKSLQEKVNILNTKLFESKNQNLTLKNDLKLVNKILQQELGENFTSVQNYSTNGCNWRGRAQQIISLQQKNSELLERLSLVDSKETVCSAKVDNKKQVIEQLNKDLNNLKLELEENRKKFNAAKARIKVLETESSFVKCKTSSQQEKIKHDEELIKLLKNQISYLEESQNNILKENQANWESQTKKLDIEMKKEKCKLENLQREIKEKDDKIIELINELKIYKNEDKKSLYNASNKDLQSKVNILEVEINRLSELVGVLNNRLENERNQLAEIQQNYRKERQLAARLETKALRLEMENNMYKSQTYSKSSLSKSSLATNSEDGNLIMVENLKNSLELSQENARALESRLSILQREKDMDFQRFRAILNDTKNLINIKELST